MSPKLLSLAILSTMFLFTFGQRAEGSDNLPGKKNKNGAPIQVAALAHSGASATSTVNNGSTKDRLDQDVKTFRSRVEVDYWTLMRSQFIWNLVGKQSVPVTSAPGC